MYLNTPMRLLKHSKNRFRLKHSTNVFKKTITMKPNSYLIAIVLILFFSTLVSADSVVLKNGDRVTGKIVKKDADLVTIQTEAMGVVKIKWSAVSQAVVDDPASVTLADGKILEGTIVISADSAQISASGSTVTVAPKEVSVIRSKEEQVKFEADARRTNAKGIFAFWSGTVDMGFSMTSGNSDTRSFSGGFKGIRETPKNRLSAYANALQVRNFSTGTVRITAQSVWWGARYDADIKRKWFGFASSDFEYNKPQKLDLRTVLGGGIGYHAVKGDKASLDFTFGGTNNRESFSTGLSRNSAELLIGQDLKMRINNRARLTNRFNVYPNLSNSGAVRALLDASLQTDLNSWLGWHVTIGNRYNNRPVTATEKNDFLMSTGLRVSFGKNRKR